MPTRLAVLLQRRKSAAAEPFHRHATASASAGQSPDIARAKREAWGWESLAIMRRSYINSLTISRGRAGTVNAPGACFPRYGKQDSARYCPVLPADMAKSVTIPTLGKPGKRQGNGHGNRRQDPHGTRGRRVPAPGRASARPHRRAKYRSDESGRLLSQLSVQLDERRGRRQGRSLEQGRKPRGCLWHAL